MSGRGKKSRRRKQERASWLQDQTSPLFVSCSACSFRVETLRAVETGWSSSDFVGLRYRFCPACGLPMKLPGQDASRP